MSAISPSTPGRRGGRPAALTVDQLDIARARQARGESVTTIAAHLSVGRSTLYRALQPDRLEEISPATILERTQRSAI